MYLTEENIQNILRTIDKNYKNYNLPAPNKNLLNKLQKELDFVQKINYILKEFKFKNIVFESRSIVKSESGDLKLRDLVIRLFDFDTILKLNDIEPEDLEDKFNYINRKIKYLENINIKDFKYNLILSLKEERNHLTKILKMSDFNNMLSTIKEELSLKKEKYLVIDTETNSFYRKNQPGSGMPIQIAYLVTDLEKIYERDSFYIKQDWIDPGAEKVHKISVDKLKELDAYNHLEAYYRISDVLKEDYTIVGHNISFDVGVINRFLEQALESYNTNNVSEEFEVKQTVLNNKTYCTLTTARKDNTIKSKDNKLTTLVEYFGFGEEFLLNLTNKIFGDSGIGAHDARYDVVATMMLLRKFK